MALSLVNASSAGSSDGTNVTTSGVDTTGANLIVLGVASFADAGAPTPTDNKSNTYTGLTVQTASGGVRFRLFYVVNPTVGTGHTFSASSASTFPSITMLAFSGAHSTPFDQENGAANGVGSPSTISTGSVTPSEDNEVLVTGVASSANVSSIDGSFTLEESVAFTGAQNWAIGAAYKIQTTAGSENPQWTTGSSTFGLATAIATFKAAAAGGPQPGQAALTLAGQGTRLGFTINMPDEP